MSDKIVVVFDLDDTLLSFCDKCESRCITMRGFFLPTEAIRLLDACVRAECGIGINTARNAINITATFPLIQRWFTECHYTPPSNFFMLGNQGPLQYGKVDNKTIGLNKISNFYGSKLSNTIMIDDREEVIEESRAAGFQAVWVNKNATVDPTSATCGCSINTEHVEKVIEIINRLKGS